MYNKHDSLTCRHKITQDWFEQNVDQSVNENDIGLIVLVYMVPEARKDPWFNGTLFYLQKKPA